MSYKFLASPYSHPQRDGLVYRHWQVCKLLGVMLERGEIVFSPIAHSHLTADLCNLPTDCPFWERINFRFLEQSSGLIVAMFSDWERSKGIEREVDKAKELQLPIAFIDPRNYGIDPNLPPHLK